MATFHLVLNLLLIATVLAKPSSRSESAESLSDSRSAESLSDSQSAETLSDSQSAESLSDKDSDKKLLPPTLSHRPRPAEIYTRLGNPDERGEYEGGDMVLTPDQIGIDTKAGIKGANYRWPKGKIPYVIDSNFTATERKVIMEAINEIQNKTCIRLNLRASETDYITIVRGASNSGCWSNVGRIGGNQNVNLQPGSPGCVTKGVIAHELIHAIGFYHEQSRSDRDQYVTIVYQNIKPSSVHNFNKYSTSQVNPFGVSYDYGSLMHYSAYAFSSNGNATITAKSSAGRNIGQRNGLSAKDAQKINNMYNNCA